MKRFHVNLTVGNLQRSVDFYSMLFGHEPTVSKADYAKWMLDDPRINFSIATGGRPGINHLGLQAETSEGLQTIQRRMSEAGQQTFEQADAECCYARSTKSWVRDPDEVSWETFVTHGPLGHYGSDREPDVTADSVSNAKTGCCETNADSRCCA